MLQAARRAPVRPLGQSLLDLRLGGAVLLAQLAAHPLDRSEENALLASGVLTELELEFARAYMLNTPVIDVDRFSIDPAALLHLPWAEAASHHVLPLGLRGGTLYVASDTPLRRELEIELGMIAGSKVALVWASTAQIMKRLAQEAHSLVNLVPLTKSAPAAIGGLKVSGRSVDVSALVADALSEMKSGSGMEQVNAQNESSSVIKLVNRMITDAFEQKASDIHIETNAGDEVSRIRFRKDGDLEDYLLLPVPLRAAVVSRIKIMSRLDISERRRPQDGKINFHEFSEVRLEMRVAILPTHDGLEDVVMRLLATSKPIPLQQLGFSARDDEIIKRLAEHPFGLILACGPTGSGKTTTLHSLLAHINTDSRKIWTAEDPIEITQYGLRQLQVNPKIGVTFASAMRAFLRADPDVIMIGEVRDVETAAVCIEASLTGHLVMSTLHTNSAAESVIRLLDLGMDPMNFGDSLLAIVAQRLVRALCKFCAAPQALGTAQFEALVKEYVEGTPLTVEEGHRRLQEVACALPGGDTPPTVYSAVGCDRCGGRGYKGRMGIYEILENTAPMKYKIQSRAPTSEIATEAIRLGMRTLHQDALEKVLQGSIDLKQARQV